MSENINAVTDTTFDADVLNSSEPVLVDFWASWCAPCRAISPLIDELSIEYAGRIKFAKVNVDENPSIPGRYGIRGIPTLILFKDGQAVDQVVGAVPKSTIVNLLNKAT